MAAGLFSQTRTTLAQRQRRFNWILGKITVGRLVLANVLKPARFVQNCICLNYFRRTSTT
jgi:hypothetical protein